MKKKNENKGFTLVELIVVLVILAILAAILVPALLGYIDRARGQQDVLNAKSYMTAAQAELSSIYGKGDTEVKSADITRIVNTADVDPMPYEVIVYVGKWSGSGIANNHAAYTVKRVKYTAKQNGDVLFFNGQEWITNPQGNQDDSASFTTIKVVTNKVADTTATQSLGASN